MKSLVLKQNIGHSLIHEALSNPYNVFDKAKHFLMTYFAMMKNLISFQLRWNVVYLVPWKVRDYDKYTKKLKISNSSKKQGAYHGREAHTNDRPLSVES